MKHSSLIRATSLCIAVVLTSPASAAEFPAGVYAASGVDLSFDHAGNFHVSVNGTTMVEGAYTVSADRLELADKHGPWACKPGQTGMYRWKADGDMLTLGNVADTCEDRVNTLTPHPWKKQK